MDPSYITTAPAASSHIGAAARALYLELQNPPEVLVLGERPRAVAAVGSTVTLGCAFEGVTRRWDLLRAPPGAAARVTEARLTLTRPGLYILACTLDGGWRRVFEIVAVPQAALDNITPKLPALARRTWLALVTAPECTSEAIMASLESPEPRALTWGLDGTLHGQHPKTGINTAAWGAPNR